jgi:ribosomal protein L11 methyltransferase
MSNYCEITIPAAQSVQELLIAELAQIGYEGFEESDTSLKAYITEDQFIDSELNILLNKYDLKYSISVINKQNWNELWESNFEPVQVDEFVGIRASFHPSFTNVAYEIVITPKMSFGTGHHATTYSVMQLMRDLDFRDKTVFDFGTGTGILAILAEKLGANKLLAVDNDDWCIENASENISINNCKYIDIQKVEKCKLTSKYKIILANINKNIILDNIEALAGGLEKGGDLILSGLLIEDEADIRAACEALKLVHKTTIQRAGWIACRFSGENL